MATDSSISKLSDPDADSSRPGEQHAELDIAEIVARHQVTVWRYLHSLGAEPALADDLTQDTFLEIMRRPLQQFSDAATASYLRRVAHNLFITRRRRESRMTVTEHAEKFESAWVRWAGFDGGNRALDALAECFPRLTERTGSDSLTVQERCQPSVDRNQTRDYRTRHKNLMQRAKSLLRDCVERKLK